MQIVIDIPDIVWEKAKEYGHLDICGIELSEKVMNGTPLPEGHGRLGDLDAVMDDINRSIEGMTNIGIMVDGEYLWGKLNDAIYNAPTIIEAEKEESKE